MSESRIERIEELFHAASDLTPDEREEYLRRTCDDGPTRAEVLALLAEHDSPSRRVEEAVERGAVDAVAPPPPLPERIGHYRVLRRIGSGGMGTVFEAEQDAPRRRVALKLVRGVLHPDAERRFREEAEILGRLRHPGIAAVHESGVHVEGSLRVPYLAMELVENARTITDHASQEGLSTAARVTLFRSACDAVHYGHLRGVIHRDLKPANLLVDRDGRLKVIDFGVARLADDDPEHTRLTAAGQLVGTLEYMSPEQLDGVEIDVRTDVFALGVVLYELLCGRRPITLENVPLSRAVRLVSEARPTRPRSLVPALAKDLEAVVLMALEPDADRRYSSVADLSADLERHLGLQPVLARRPRSLESALLFVRRHRALSAAVAVVIVVLAFATAVSVRFALDADRSAMRAERSARDAFEAAARAELESDTRYRTLSFVLNLFRSKDPRRTNLEEQRVSELLTGLGDRIRDDLAGQTDVQGMLFWQFAALFEARGRRTEARHMIEQALEIARRTPNWPADDIPRMLHLLGQTTEDPAEKERLYRSALEGTPPDDPAREAMLLDLATVLIAANRWKEAEPILEDLSSRAEIDAQPFGTSYVMSQFRMKQGNLGEALRHAERARAAIEGEGPSLDLCAAWNQIGLVHRFAGESEAALAAYGRSMDLLEELSPDDHRSIAVAHANVARLLASMGREEEALGHFVKAGDRFEAALGNGVRPTIDARYQLFVHLANMQRFEEAERTGRVVLETIRTSIAPAGIEAGRAMWHLARCRHGLGDPEGAKMLREEAEEMLASIDPNGLVTFWFQVAEFDAAANRLDDACALLQRALEFLEGQDPPDASRTGACRTRLAATLSRLGRDEEALDQLRTAADRLAEQHGDEHADTIGVRLQLVQHLMRQKGFEEAESLLRRLLAAIPVVAGPSGEPVGRTLALLAECRRGVGDEAGAKALDAEAAKILARSPQKD